jgi:ADP-ribose pyrophosphatase
VKPWKRIEPTIVSKIGYRTIVSKTFVQPDGNVHHYQTMGAEDSHCIATIALTPENKVIVSRQYRPAMERVLDELPGGGVEAGEDYEAAARRELLEETGYEAGTMTFIGNAYKDAYTNITWHFFLATHCTPHKDGQRLDDTEYIDAKLISIDQLLENGRQCRMTDTEALFLAYDKLMKLKEGTHDQK